MMIPLSLQMAIRFSRGKYRSKMVSLTSMIVIFGNVIGISILIIGLSIMNGFKYELDERILGIIPHGEIEPIDSSFHNWHQIIESIKQVSGIIDATPYISFTSLIECKDKMRIFQMRGISSLQEVKFHVLSNFINNNSCQCFSSGKRQIIIGKGGADYLKVKQGDWVTIIIPNNNLQDQLLSFNRIRVQVSGILSLNGSLDQNIVLLPLVDVQDYLSKNSDVSGIAIRVNDIFNITELIQKAMRIIDFDVCSRSWIDSYGYIYQDIKMIRFIIYLTMTLIIGIACFNIISMLVMAVKEKNKDIAILRTIGAGDILIQAIFIWYGLIVGVFGSIMGAIIGILISVNITGLGKQLEYFLGHELLSRDIYFINFLPTHLQIGDVISIIGIELLLSILASWYPALRANRVNPSIELK